MKCVQFYKILFNQPNTEQPPTTTSLPVAETNKAGSPDNFNINQVQDYEVQELNSFCPSLQV